jgi:hypothetical protein
VRSALKPTKTTRVFQTILNRKDAVSYLDDIVDDAEAAALLERLGAFSRWAEKTFADLRRRPKRRPML